MSRYTNPKRELQENLRLMPLSTLMKAQRSLKPANDSDSDSGSEDADESGSVKAKRLAEAKKRLAEMQRRKGKAIAVSAALDDLEDEDGSEDEFEDMRKSRGGGDPERERKERVKRDNKHALVVLCLCLGRLYTDDQSHGDEYQETSLSNPSRGRRYTQKGILSHLTLQPILTDRTAETLDSTQCPHPP
jgi:hypothetical protein